MIFTVTLQLTPLQVKALLKEYGDETPVRFSTHADDFVRKVVRVNLDHLVDTHFPTSRVKVKVRRR